jgi:YggT family protein
MFLLANFLIAGAQLLDYLLWGYAWILLARVVISYVNADPSNPAIRLLYGLTEPVLEQVRRRLPISAGGFDLSPLVVWLAVMFLQRFLVRSLVDLARAIG